jgi:LDH2 family malate/lactate/ureidoglycolate dehydrogenase
MIEDMNEGKVALLPIGGLGESTGGHKGYGLSTMVEIFSAAFQDGTYLWGLTDVDADGKPQFLRIGHFFLAIDIEHFIPLEVFRKISGSMMRELRESPKAPGQARIYTAGEKEFYSTQRILAEGVEIPAGVQKALKSLGEEFNIPTTELGF